MKRFLLALTVSIATLAALSANAYAITKAELLKKVDESTEATTSYDLKVMTRTVESSKETGTHYYTTTTKQETCFTKTSKVKGTVTRSTWSKYSQGRIDDALKEGNPDFAAYMKDMETPYTVKIPFYVDSSYIYLKPSADEGWYKNDVSDNLAIANSLTLEGLNSWYESLETGKNLKLAGTEKVGDYDCHKLTGILKSDLIKAIFEASANPIILQDIRWGDIRGISITLWIDKKTYFPIKYVMNYKNCFQDIDAQVDPDTQLTYDTYTDTYIYSNINKAKDFTIPSEVYKAKDYEEYLAKLDEEASDIPGLMVSISDDSDMRDAELVDAKNPIAVKAETDFATREPLHTFVVYAEAGHTIVFANPEIDHSYKSPSSGPILFTIPDIDWVPANFDPKKTSLTVKPDIRVVDKDGKETKLDAPSFSIPLKNGKVVAKPIVYDNKAFQIDQRFDKPVDEEIVTVTGQAPVGHTFTIRGEASQDGKTTSGISKTTYEFDTGKFTFRAHLRKPGEKHTFLITVDGVSKKLVIERAAEKKS